MAFGFDYIKKLVNNISSADTNTQKQEAINKAASYVNSMDTDTQSQMKAAGLSIFSSGDEFKNHITTSTGIDDSIFTKSMSEISNLDLSGLGIEKASDDADDENHGFYSAMNEIYSNDIFLQTIDKDGDGKISNDEAQSFLNEIKGLDNNDKDVSLDDFAKLIDAAAPTDDTDAMSELFGNYKNQFNDVTENFLNSLSNNTSSELSDFGVPNAQSAYDNIVSDARAAQGTGSAPSSSNSSSGASSASQAQSTPVQTAEEKKAELEEKIESCNKEISDIGAGVQEDIKKAAQDRDNAKEEMEKKLEEDKKVDKELKESFNEKNNEIEKKDQEISQCEAQYAEAEASLNQAKDGLSSLKDALSSLASPTGKEEDAESDKKINERKSELESQIKEKENEVKQAEDKLEELGDKKEALAKEKEDLVKEKEDIQKEIEASCSNETKEAISNYDEKTKALEELKTSKLNEVKAELKTAQEELKKADDEIQNAANKKAESNFDADFDEMLGQVLGYEGGFSDHPNDKGGATNYGITEATYRDFTGDPNADVKNITPDQVKEIYYQRYYQASGAQEYAKNGNSSYAFLVFDAAVNHGVGGAAELDAKANGDVDKFMQARKQKYINIVANNSSQRVFEKGWQNRWNEVYSYIDPSHQYENYIS